MSKLVPNYALISAMAAAAVSPNLTPLRTKPEALADPYLVHSLGKSKHAESRRLAFLAKQRKKR